MTNTLDARGEGCTNSSRTQRVSLTEIPQSTSLQRKLGPHSEEDSYFVSVVAFQPCQVVVRSVFIRGRLFTRVMLRELGRRYRSRWCVRVRIALACIRRLLVEGGTGVCAAAVAAAPSQQQ